MEVTKGPKRTDQLENFFDDSLTTTSHELLFDGKPYSQLTPDEIPAATRAVARKRAESRGTWAFLVGLGGFCLLMAAHLTLFGIVFVAAVVAAICTALVRY